MTPTCRISVDGTLVSGVFSSRIISCEVTDNEGDYSDTVRIELNDYPFAAIPRKGAIIRVWLGYGVAGVAYMGAFTADEIEVHLFPFRMSIAGRGADFRKAAKENRERHWDETTLGDIVRQIASENGWEAKVDPAIGAHFYEWLGQQNESDFAFLQRMADRHGALFSVKDGNLIFARRGAGETTSGEDLTPYTVVPANLLPGTGRVRFSDRTQYKAVKASYTDPATVLKVDVSADSDAEGTAVYRIGEQFADAAEAMAAAKAKAAELKRRQAAFSCTVIGDPTARAGAPLAFAVGRPGVDGLPFIIGTATHRYSKAGYTTALSGESKDGQRAANDNGAAAAAA